MDKKILLVEDDPILVELYQQKLNLAGFEVQIAGDGEEGLDVAIKSHPDLILLDIGLPKMDGMTMMQKLREDEWGKNASIIILTNLDPSDKFLLGVIEHHPTYYLLKSNMTPEDVIQKINDILQDKKN